jgi:regulatory protein
MASGVEQTPTSVPQVGVERPNAGEAEVVGERGALEVAYRYISVRERTVAEVGAKLSRAGCEPEHAQGAIGELRRLGALDDARYARLFVADKQLLEDWGAERITRELARRGVEPELIEAALAEGVGPGSELERAVALIGRRWGGELDDVRHRRRALGLLVRKGYDAEVAHEALAIARRRCTDDLNR